MDKRTTSRQVTDVVGIDMQSIYEVEESLAMFGDRYARRLYTNHEIELSRGDSLSIARSYAGRFAAKEAVLKILNPREMVPSWKDIEVHDLKSGKSDVVLRRAAAELAHQRGVVDVAVRISFGGGFAMAAALARVEIR